MAEGRSNIAALQRAQRASNEAFITTNAALDGLRFAAGPHRHLTPVVNAVIKAIEAERKRLLDEWDTSLKEREAILDRMERTLGLARSATTR